MNPEFESLIQMGAISSCIVADGLLGASIAGYFFLKQEVRAFKRRTGKEGRLNTQEFIDIFSEYHNWKPVRQRFGEWLHTPLVVRK